MGDRTKLDVIEEGIASGDLLCSAGYYTTAVKLYTQLILESLQLMALECRLMEMTEEVIDGRTYPRVMKYNLKTLRHLLLQGNVALEFTEEECSAIWDLRRRLKVGVPDFDVETCAYCAGVAKRIKGNLRRVFPCGRVVNESAASLSYYDSALRDLESSEWALSAGDYGKSISASCSAFIYLLEHVLCEKEEVVCDLFDEHRPSTLAEDLDSVESVLGSLTWSGIERQHMVTYITGQGLIGRNAALHCLRITKEFSETVSVGDVDDVGVSAVDLFNNKGVK